MGNLFLGFPVPRAKIADMIAGSAPPALHKTQHQDGGTDEIDVTGLVGAGGAGIGLNDLLFQTYFESLDGFYQSVTGSGVISISSSIVTLNTGATASSQATIRKDPYDTIPPWDWSKNCQLNLWARFVANASNIAEVWAIIGYEGANQHVGFYVYGGKLYGTVADFNAVSTLLLEDFGATAYNKARRLIAKLTAGVECRYWVNGVDKGAIITNLPAGLSGGQPLCYGRIKNLTAAEQKILYLSQWLAWNAA